MIGNRQKLERAWNLLQIIPVSGALVDTMHEIRVLLADVHENLTKEASEGHGEKVHE